MGYTTFFTGEFSITPALKPEHKAYLKAFSRVRHVAWCAQIGGQADPVRLAVGLPVGENGTYYVGDVDPYGGLALDHNGTPPGVPGLWCHWRPDTDTSLAWDGSEKFYDYEAWLEYLIEHFLAPWGYAVEGTVEFQGEASDDRGVIGIKGNKVRTYTAPPFKAPSLDEIFAE